MMTVIISTNSFQFTRDICSHHYKFFSVHTWYLFPSLQVLLSWHKMSLLIKFYKRFSVHTRWLSSLLEFVFSSLMIFILIHSFIWHKMVVIITALSLQLTQKRLITITYSLQFTQDIYSLLHIFFSLYKISLLNLTNFSAHTRITCHYYKFFSAHRKYLPLIITHSSQFGKGSCYYHYIFSSVHTRCLSTLMHVHTGCLSSFLHILFSSQKMRWLPSSLHILFILCPFHTRHLSLVLHVLFSLHRILLSSIHILFNSHRSSSDHTR